MTASPTPPQPITATEDPSRTGVAQSAAPAPVEKPQASSVACSIGSSSGTLTAHASCTTAWSANVPQRSTGVSSAPSAARCSRRLARSCEEQRRGSPRRHCGHSPHGARHATTTRSPGATDVTSLPTSSTTPAPSWPSRIGNREPQPLVSTMWRSEWQSPQAWTRTSTSRGPGGSTVSSSTTRRRVGLGVDDAARHASVTVTGTGLESVTSPAAAAHRAIRAAA